MEKFFQRYPCTTQLNSNTRTWWAEEDQALGRFAEGQFLDKRGRKELHWSVFYPSVASHASKSYDENPSAPGTGETVSTNSIHGNTKSLFWMINYSPLFPSMLYRPSRESVKGRPEAREASLLLGLKHIILQGHQIIKKQELSCKLRGRLLFSGCGWGLQAFCSKLGGLRGR